MKNKLLKFLRKNFWLIVIVVLPITISVVQHVKRQKESNKMVEERDVAEKFLVSSVIDIDENRIQYRREIDVKDEFVISFFSVDSLYNFLVVKLNNKPLGVFQFGSSQERKEAVLEDSSVAILENTNPSYHMFIELSVFSMKNNIRYFISPFVDNKFSYEEGNGKYSFRSRIFRLEDNEGRYAVIFSQLTPSLRMTVDLENYQDSNGNFYAFILYQDGDKDFLSIKDILEK